MSMSSRRRSLGRWGKRGSSGAGSLVDRAGQASAAAGVAEGAVELLETRQLLFTVTITPDLVDPNTGLGRVITDFAYVIPFHTKELPEPGDPGDEGVYAEFNDSRVFGARIIFIGPLGATYTIEDLYGRDMEERLDLLTPEGEENSNVDLNDDGVPDFNDGIGSITIAGANLRTSFSMSGGIVELVEGEAVLNLASAVGLGHEFEEAGFGYFEAGEVLGLPDTGSSVIIGGNIVRDNATPDDYLLGGFPPMGNRNPLNFRREEQGIFLTDGSNIGQVRIAGIVHGQMVFEGAVNKIELGMLLGDLTVDGDLNTLTVASDSGGVVQDDGFDLITTGNRIVIGRTLREISVGGRLATDIVVIADTGNPNRNRITLRNYSEREVMYDAPGAPPETIQFLWLRDGGTIFNGGYYRNESIADAEFVGYNGTTVKISGTFDGADSVNAEDSVDFYAFPAQKGREVVVGVDQGNLTGLQIVNQFGVVLAAVRGVDAQGNNVLRFTPDSTDVYYVQVAGNTDPNSAGSAPYAITISGMAAVTAGSIRAAGSTSIDNDSMILQVLGGSTGAVRVGTGLVASDLNFITPIVNLIAGQSGDSIVDLSGSTLTLSSHLYGLYVGGDIRGVQANINGNVGSIRTGMAYALGGTELTGDMYNADIRVAGRIGTIAISGALAADQAPPSDALNGSVIIVTGTGGGSGDIGELLVGAYVNGPGFTLQLASNSFLDAFIIGSPAAESQYAGQYRGTTQNVRTGVGSNIRFVDFSRVQSPTSNDAVYQLNYNQSITLVDDSGGLVTFRIVRGGGTNDGPDFADSSAQIRVLPINGSEGVAIARIDVSLVDGANLIIERTGSASGTVEIGHIRANVTGSGNSNIDIRGTGEIDVYRVSGIGDANINQISNTTQGGDIVMIDATTLNSILIDKGNLGQTQTHGIGRDRIGRFYGLAGEFGGVDEPIGINLEVLSDGNPFAGGQANWWLDGAIVREGDLLNVRVSGSVGDVLVQQGHLLNLVANSDNSTVTGGFDGIVGNVYAVAIGLVDVGDGLAAPGPSPFAEAGIFADDDIVRVIATRVQGAVIGGVIAAANVESDEDRTTIGTEDNEIPIDAPVNGIGRIEITNGRFDHAYILSSFLNFFWSRPPVGDQNTASGDITLINAINTDMFHSTIIAVDIESILLDGGDFDASQVKTKGNVGLIRADRFLNSLRLGTTNEFRESHILVSGDLRTVRTNLVDGDMSDLRIDVLGSVAGSIEASDFNRVGIDVDNQIVAIAARGSVRASAITAGRLDTLTIAEDLRLSSINIAGPILNIMAGGTIDQALIASNGPGGRIENITSQGGISGTITSSGRIVLINALGGDIEGTIQTTGEGATLQTLRATGDIIVDLLVVGNVNEINAGGHVGERGENGSRLLDIRGNLDNLTAGGQVYTNILVGQTIGLIRNARVTALPNNDQVSNAFIRALGRIESLQLFGDFNGDIISESGGIGTIVITGGSFRQGNSIIAHDGSITRLAIVDGHLLGNVIADVDIDLIELYRGEDRFTGHIGVASALSTSDAFKNGRNELPPGTIKDAGYNGALIFAGRDIKEVNVERGRMFESQIHAGRNIDTVFIQGGVRNDSFTLGSGGSGITAGNHIDMIDLNGFAAAVIVAAGVTDLGADMRAGGTGADADTVTNGTISRIDFARRSANVQIAAGITADPVTGRYNGENSQKTTGESSIGTVRIGLKRTNVSVFADGAIGSTPSGVTTGGEDLDVADPDRLVDGPVGVELAKGQFTTITFLNNQTAQVRLDGPGRLFFDQATGTVAVLNTTSGSELVIRGGSAALSTIRVRSNDGSRLGLLSVETALTGSSSVFIDDGIDVARFARLDTTGLLGTGKDINQLIISDSFLNGSFEARDIGSINIAGDLGRGNVQNDATFKVRDIGTFRSNNLYGYVSSDLDIDSVVTGAVVAGGVRAGRTLTSVTAASLTDARIIAGVELTTLNVSGNVSGATIYAGGDLGRDVAFGGVGVNADTVSNGTIGTVTIGGNFLRSDIAAGLLRGQDGFLGTPDDLVISGRSSIGTVTIGGTQVGSNAGSESYRVISNGTIGSVRVGGNEFTSMGNFAVQRLDASSAPVVVQSLKIEEFNRAYRAVITFNQQVNSATIAAAIGVAEVRNGSEIVLVPGTDFTVSYDRATNSAIILFNQDITNRDLPQTNGVAGPGVFRFFIDADELVGQTVDSRLDGDADGNAGDDYSADAFVGDAGDKITAGNPMDDPNIDFYGPSDLDEVLDNNYNADGRPDINKGFSLRGWVGDHPDSSAFGLSASGDVDIYTITLSAGQILRLSSMGGVAVNALRVLANAAGDILVANGTNTDQIITLPTGLPDATEVGSPSDILIKESGTYYLVVSAAPGTITSDDQTLDLLLDTNIINQSGPIAGASGTYEFTIEVFDDGDSGFRGDTDSGDGRTLVNAPLPSAFAGNDGILGTGDDRGSITIGGFTFDLSKGNDGVYGTKDDIVSGSDGRGGTSVRLSGKDNIFGTADDRVTTSVNSAIGAEGLIGLPTEASADVDIFHLNNGEAIDIGTRLRITLRLTDLGSNLGLNIPNGFENGINPTFGELLQNLGNVQFGIFEVTGDTGFNDALLVASPSEFAPIGDQPESQNGDGAMTYGYDANGDFYIEFVSPGSLANENAAAAYAVYIQGISRSNYTLEVLTAGRRSQEPTTQNIFLELNGGVIDWLQSGTGVTTTLAGYNATDLGFSGLIGAQAAGDYIISQLIANLTAVFAAAGVDVNISSNVRDFEGQTYSTVFLSSSIEPTPFYNDGSFGYSEHVDVFNTDPDDQAVVYLSQIGALDFDPNQAGADIVASALTAAVGRRIGELTGLRITTGLSEDAMSPFNIMASDSVGAAGAGVFRFLNESVALSDHLDGDRRTNFFLGHQNAGLLIDRIMATP